MKIAYYISGHGFGHISRSYEIIKYLAEKKEVDEIIVSTTRKDFVKEKKPKISFRTVNTDVGMIQLSSISLNLEKTLDALFEFEKGKPELLDQEISFLRENKIDVIISDSSSFPFVFANKLNLPSYFVGNFTWDFIYQNYIKIEPKFEKFVTTLKAEYQFCKLGLILPFHCPVDSIPKTKNVGIVGRKSFREREEIRESIGFTDKNEYFLFSFGAYGISETFHFQNLSENQKIVISGYEGLTGKNVIDVSNIHYPDLVKACDYVLTKPGYGILSEAYLANTPIIYTDRGDFAEYEYLVQALYTYHYATYITQKELLEFDLEKATSEILLQKKNKSLPFLPDGSPQIFQELFF